MTSKKAPRQVDVHVGNRLRMRRIMLKMSQERLGDAVGITFQQIQKYEKGTNRIGASRLYEIAQQLNVEPSFFFEGLETNGDTTVADAALLNATHIPGAIDLLRAYQKLPARARKGVLTSAKALAAAA